MTHASNDKSEVSHTSPQQDHTPVRPEPVVIPSPDKHEASHARPAGSGRSRSKKAKGKVMKFIRRVHLYTGLMLLPWVLLFGASGFMYNHMDLFSTQPPTTTAAVSADQNSQTLGFGAVDPGQLAQTIVASLNEQAEAGNSRYELVSENDAQLHGVMTYDSTGPAGQKHRFQMSLRSGKATITTTNESEEEETPRSVPDFSGARVPVAGIEIKDLPARIGELSQQAGVESDGKWRAGRGGPQLRFQLRDENQRVWNVTYNIMNSQLAGRAEDEPVTTNIATIMTALHKQHHYPAETSMKTVWIIIADITALTMVFWGISGVIMWWQLKPTRALGLAGLVLMGLVAFVVFSGVLDEMYFGPPRTRGGPAVRTPVRPAAVAPAARATGNNGVTGATGEQAQAAGRPSSRPSGRSAERSAARTEEQSSERSTQTGRRGGEASGE